ncbi:unnamed protein product [Nesidiocoris tenuis]|uniref:Uncharacterized protein n=1 Tax=Nesidiocoris tenuis TaxID=355587 RepID=A0A6H5G739_9HEMI|nr:unnamed protein product [Nesidiocoris tenuis]
MRLRGWCSSSASHTAHCRRCESFQYRSRSLDSNCCTAPLGCSHDIARWEEYGLPSCHCRCLRYIPPPNGDTVAIRAPTSIFNTTIHH